MSLSWKVTGLPFSELKFFITPLVCSQPSTLIYSNLEVQNKQAEELEAVEKGRYYCRYLMDMK